MQREGNPRSFSNEKLMLIQERPWFADMANFKDAQEFSQKILHGIKRRNSCMMQSSLFGMIPSCLSLALIIS